MKIWNFLNKRTVDWFSCQKSPHAFEGPGQRLMSRGPLWFIAFFTLFYIDSILIFYIYDMLANAQSLVALINDKSYDRAVSGKLFVLQVWFSLV